MCFYPFNKLQHRLTFVEQPMLNDVEPCISFALTKPKHWIVIYLLDSAIHLLNNRGLVDNYPVNTDYPVYKLSATFNNREQLNTLLSIISFCRKSKMSKLSKLCLFRVVPSHAVFRRCSELRSLWKCNDIHTQEVHTEPP